MRTNPTLVAGVLAPLVYAFTVILGGRLTPGYSHLAHPISGLMMQQAPAAAALQPLFTVYNVLIIVFAWGFRRAFRGRGLAVAVIAPALLALVGVVGILIGFYPMDPIGAPLTFAGSAHIWLAAFASIGTMLTLLAVGFPLRRDPAWRGFAGYSLVTFIVVFFSGGYAALAAARASPVMGLWERVTIGVFELWVLVAALVLIARGGLAGTR